MKKALPVFFVIATFFNLSAQNAACDGTRFKQPVFSSVKKTTVVYAPALTYAELPPSQPDTVFLKMDVYEPVGDVAVKRPVVILEHGGSFIVGDKNDMKEDCQRLAKAGYVAVTIQYRLYPALLIGFPDSIDIIGAVAKAMADMKAAVRYFRQDAATANLFKADPDHIFIGGYSAGAVAALHTAYLDETDELPPFVQAAFDTNGGLNGNSGTAVNQTYSSTISGVYSRSGGLYRRNWIDGGQVPMVSIHGTADNTVFYETGLAAGIAYLEGSGIIHPYALTQNVDSYLEMVVGGDHVNMYTDPQYVGQVNNFFNKAVEKFESITCLTSGVEAAEILQPSALAIAPNPASNTFALQLLSSENGASVHVFDLQGRQVSTTLNYQSGQSIAIGHLPAGIYSVLLQTGVGRFRQGQLVKQ